MRAEDTDTPGRRIGVFIGSDSAPPGREALRHAQTDARRMRDVLVDLGDLRSEDAIVLEGPGPAEILRALEGLRERAEREPPRTFIFYYSGHADERALLLGRAELALSALARALAGIPAKLSLQLFDACRSGALTRTKGAKLGPPVAMATESAEGRVVISSSLEWEDSQESDRLEGSFFTFHLATGLRGPADADGDGRITISEAYAYVYDRTVESTLATTAGPQHPSFHFDLKGHGDVVMTRTGASTATLLFAAGDYLVVDEDREHVVAEVRARAAGERLALRPGRYRVTKRSKDEVLEGGVDIEPDTQVFADQYLTHRLDKESLVRKGGGPLVAHSVMLETGVRGSLGLGIEAAPFVRVGWSFALPWLTIRPHFSFSSGAGPRTPRLTYDVRELAAGLGALREQDVAFFTVSGGVVADAVWLTQVETRGREPARDAVGFVAGALLSVGLTPLRGFRVSAASELDAYGFPATSDDRAPTGPGDLLTRLTYRLMGSIAYEL
ncbi:MAG: caspase family protein [Deltaproteobacteria bacterium]|nr:caspase family protein [Deltaproteobacteria bacterium]